MERLTSHSKYSGTPTPNLKTIGDVCMKMPFCDDYDACEGCEIRRIIDRLCEYEDTGLTPTEIVDLKEKKNTAKARQFEDDTVTVNVEVFLSNEEITILI